MGNLSRWSKTPINNQNADPAINWLEGQLGPTINDSARSMMATLAEWRDDTSGLLVSTGTATAYSVTTNQAIDAYRDGLAITFRPHVMNGASATFKVLGLADIPIQLPIGTAIPAGILRPGVPVSLVYIAASNAFLLVSTDRRDGRLIKLATGGFGAGATSLTLTGLEGASRIIVKFNKLVVVNNANIQFDIGNASSVFLGAAWAGTAIRNTTAANISQQTGTSLSVNGGIAGCRFHGQIEISGFTPETTEDLFASANIVYDQAASGAWNLNYRSESPLVFDRLRISAASGNITGGYVQVLGLF